MSVFSFFLTISLFSVVSSQLMGYSNGGQIDCSEFTSSVMEQALTWVSKSLSDPNEVPTVRFFASSRMQRQRVELTLDAQLAYRLRLADFRNDRATVVIVHGFRSSGFKSWIKQMEDAFLLWGDVNVVVVDWTTTGPQSYNYYTAAVNTKRVGDQLARFLQYVVYAKKMERPWEKLYWGKLHLVGHSLGAHISGIAARDLKGMMTGWRVNRITGLDPAQLCFRTAHPDFRLDRTDADFVDIIHTSNNAENIIGFGNFDPIGHVDFYANGGKTQPGCKNDLSSLEDPVGAFKNAKCSHQRAYHYFTESLINAVSNKCTFWARPWNLMVSEEYAKQMSAVPCNAYICNEMGINAERHLQARGIFYASTSSASPFCIPQFNNFPQINNFPRSNNFPRFNNFP